MTNQQAKRLAITLGRNYVRGGKVQLRRFTAADRAALLAEGWDCYARPVGNRVQLAYAPVDDDIDIDVRVTDEEAGTMSVEQCTRWRVEGHWMGKWRTYSVPFATREQASRFMCDCWAHDRSPVAMRFARCV